MIFVDKLFETRFRRNRRSASSADYIKHKEKASLEYLYHFDQLLARYMEIKTLPKDGSSPALLALVQNST